MTLHQRTFLICIENVTTTVHYVNQHYFKATLLQRSQCSVWRDYYAHWWCQNFHYLSSSIIHYLSLTCLWYDHKENVSLITKLFVNKKGHGIPLHPTLLFCPRPSTYFIWPCPVCTPVLSTSLKYLFVLLVQFSFIVHFLRHSCLMLNLQLFFSPRTFLSMYVLQFSVIILCYGF